MTAPVLDVAGALARHGWRHYGETLTQLQHAVQCAALARRDRADDELVLAALLHDIGHLPVPPGSAPAAGSEDAEHHHGGHGARILAPFLPPRVTWLVEHHVIAKRYLCTVDGRYRECLSPASRRSLEAQGGRLSPEHIAALETHPWFVDAVRLRRWDDAAKDPDAPTPPLAVYRALLERHFGPQSWPEAAGITR